MLQGILHFTRGLAMKTASIALLLAVLASATALAENVTIYRDTYGVPHIYADSLAGGAFGLGYAQAEDRLADLYDNVRLAIGRSAEIKGKQAVEQDYFMQLIENEAKCAEYWKTAPEYQKDLCNGMLAGIQAYIAEHPEAKPENALDLQPWHLICIGRAMIMRWPLGNVLDDLHSKHKNPGIGSNGWAVSSKRTENKGAILLADPHMEWEGMSLMYQAVVHAGDLHTAGFYLVGSPLVGIGHNRNVAWACTTGGPDTGDVFQMKVRMSPQGAVQYEYDGEWKDATLKMITFKVKDGKDVTRPALWTNHGPAMAEPDMAKGTIMVGSTPYFEIMDTFEQSYRMSMAKNAEEFYKALEINALMDQNIPYADTGGNIGYVRVGRTPIRVPGYDWSAPVPGWTSDTAYKGMHPLSDHVQIKNPPQGYLQNCNISPENMMVDSPMTPDKYPSYLYNVSWDTTNPRERRLVGLLSNDESVTKEEAMSYATDVYDLLAKPWQAALKAAVDAAGADHMKDASFKEVVDAIFGWDGYVVKTAVATPILKNWRLKCQDAKLDLTAISEGKALTPEAQKQLLDLLAQTIAEMKTTYGKALVPWGDIYVIGRGDIYYPADGADFGATVEGPNFTETLFDVRSEPLEGQPGKFVGNNGTMALILSFLTKDGVESYTCTPWGVSADSKSDHYMDQGRDFYSPRKLKPMWFEKDELTPNIASEKTLTYP